MDIDTGNISLKVNNFSEHSVLLRSLYAAIPLGISYALFFYYFEVWRSFLAPLVFVISVFISLVLLYRFALIKISSYLFVLSLWLAPAWTIASTGGVSSPLIIWLIPSIFLSAGLLGRNISRIIGMSSVIYILLLTTVPFKHLVINEFDSIEISNLYALLASTSAIILITFFSYAIICSHEEQVNEINQAKNSLSKAHHDLALKNEELNQVNTALENSNDAYETANIKLEAINVDLTNSNEQLKKTKQLAETANYTKSQFLATMSHEIRTPLNGLMGLCQILELQTEELKITEPLKRTIQQIYFSGEKLSLLVADILLFSDIERKIIAVKKKTVKISEILSEALSSSKEKAENKGVKFSIKNDKNITGEINTDPLLLGEVLNKVIDNAIKFTPANKQVTLNVYPEDSFTVFKIKDDGIGIPQKYSERIFESFAIGADVYSRPQEGSGLGLAISQKLIELLNGKIRFDSIIGIGSCFEVCIPNENLV